MNRLSRAVRAIPETYLLNFPQISHMLVLAAFIPWYIGMENYGLFAARLAIPGLFQSIFEASCIVLLLKYKRRDMLNRLILLIVLPIVSAIVISLFLLLDFQNAVLASAMTIFLFYRSYAFSIAISSGTLTREIVISEGLILISYLGVLVLGLLLEIRSELLPMLMIAVGCAVSSSFLLRTLRARNVMTSEIPMIDNAPRPISMVLTAISSRAYEDGCLTLSPLVLALTVSPATAGLFRVFVSIIKVAYKFFPFRYEVVMRNVISGQQSFRKLAIACSLYMLGSISIAVGGWIFIEPAQNGWYLFLLAASGAVVSCLAIYPVSCVINHRISLWVFAGLTITYISASLMGITGFAIGFSLMSYVTMLLSLFIIKNHQRKLT